MITWQPDFSALPLKDFIVQSKPNRVSLVDCARTGRKALKLRTEPGDTNVEYSGDMERCDSYQCTPGTADRVLYTSGTQWWANSFMLTEETQLPHGEAYMLVDWHNYPEQFGQSNVIIGFANWNDPEPSHWGQLMIQRFVGDPAKPTEHTVILGKPERDVWYDFVHHVHWSAKPDGFFRSWLNGRLVMDHVGPTLYQGAGQGVYFKLANYHAPVSTPLGFQASSVIHDRVILGTTLASVTQ